MQWRTQIMDEIIEKIKQAEIEYNTVWQEFKAEQENRWFEINPEYVANWHNEDGYTPSRIVRMPAYSIHQKVINARDKLNRAKLEFADYAYLAIQNDREIIFVDRRR